ncbi:MAG: dihydrofolate reductase [Alphaproteobacteria bacterium]
MTQIVIIAAVAENGVIGRGGTMPWRLKSDMKHFRALTVGKPVVMGRKTWVSTQVKPLPGRTNIVVTRDPDFTAPGVLAARSLQSALEAARGDALRRGTDIMVIGGAEIYAEMMPLAGRLEITRIHAKPEGDTGFSPIDPAVWREAAREERAAGEGDDAPFDFVTYVRVEPTPNR